MTNAIPIINSFRKKADKEASERFKKVSESIHNALIENRVDALEAELILNQMATNYAVAAKKAYVIYDRNKE